MMAAGHDFVRWFRAAAPYIHAFRGQTFVVAFGGEVVAENRLGALAEDFRLLASLGVRLVLVHGARPQIESLLRARDLPGRLIGGLRVTDQPALECVKQATGQLRVELEAVLCAGGASAPAPRASLRLAGGNFISARPRGVIDGVDLLFTGEVRRVDIEALTGRLNAGEIVLLSPLGYSPTGEVFNLAHEDVAAATAVALAAHKLIFLVESTTAGGASLPREITVSEAEALLREPAVLGPELPVHLRAALGACKAGVGRAHLVARSPDGALLLELFTHDGVGTMVTRDPLEQLRQASIEDVGGLLALLAPLEADGTLVRRGRELLEREIERFRVLEHDGMLVGCAALYPFPEDASAELAALVVHPDYRNGGAGDRLLRQALAVAREQGLARLFVLTTRATHWFLERGFEEMPLDALPRARQALYNYQRNSKVLVRPLEKPSARQTADLPPPAYQR